MQEYFCYICYLHFTFYDVTFAAVVKQQATALDKPGSGTRGFTIGRQCFGVWRYICSPSNEIITTTGREQGVTLDPDQHVDTM